MFSTKYPTIKNGVTMLGTKIQFAVILLVSFIPTQNSFAQNFLDHSTGTLTASVMADGAFGTDDSTSEFPGHVGNGVVFMGNSNVSYTGGLIMGNSSTRCSGHLGSFSIMFEMVTSTSFSGFSSNSNYNQIAACSFSDSLASIANRLGLSVKQTSYSNSGDNFVILDFIITNNTSSPVNGVYVGQFQDWDIETYLNNRGGYDQSLNLVYQYLDGGNPDPSYYGIVALSGLSGAKATTFWTPNNSIARDSAYKWMSTFQNESITTNGDYRVFIGSGPFDLETGESIRVGFAYCAGVGLIGIQETATAALFNWNNYMVPVELTSFAGYNVDGNVTLNWSTASEINNKAFEIERRKESSDFVLMGFVEGKGTTTERQNYAFIDKNATEGKYYYRLKQIDFDGAFEYSAEIEVDVRMLNKYLLEQNYPNPFNPSTKISYSIPHKSFVTLKIFDPLGIEVAALVKGEMEAGSYNVEFNSVNLPSGVYLYKITAGNFVQTKKMILIR